MVATTAETMITAIIQFLDNLNQAFGPKYYNLIALIVQVLILVVLIRTANSIGKQLSTQNKIFKVQLLKDRITMGWSTDEPITKEHIDNVKFLPKDFIPDRYHELITDLGNTTEVQKNNNMVEIGKYLYLSKVYNYFLYVHTSSEVIKLEDPLGNDWMNEWLKELLKDNVFIEVREMNAKSHVIFEKELFRLENSSQ